MKHVSKQQWNMAAILTTIVLPATMAVLPNIRRRYGMASLSLPSLLIMGGLWLWQRRLERRK